jgi:fumarate hydratase subunit beta
MIEQGRISELGINLKGAAVIHAGFSVAGFGVTSSNKEAIEGSIVALARAGVRIHIGKGSLKKSTVQSLDAFKSIFAVTPPTTALLMKKVVSSRIVAFKEEGMEAMHELLVRGLPAIVAIAQGQSILQNTTPS